MNEKAVKHLTIPNNMGQSLIKLPESGMGHQVIDLKLKDESIIRNLVAIEATWLAISEEYRVEVEDIQSFRLSEDKHGETEWINLS
jgi:hypothetical protein